MTVYVDTSAVFALLDVDDRYHKPAQGLWATLAGRREAPITSNYVLLETIALLERRLGLQAVRDFQTQFVPILRVHWVDEALHERAVAALLTAGDRSLSLVDCVSFDLMRRLGLETAFAFDAHFVRQGFRALQ